MAHHSDDAETVRKKKSHKKKKKVHDSGNDCIQTDSKLSEQEHKEKVKDSVEKFDSTDNADESVKSTLPDSSCQETPDFTVKHRHGKKRKRLHDEVKKQKIKRVAGKDKSDDVNTEHTDSATSNSAQYHSLEYLRTWKSARDRWTFQKVRQVWLLQHMYDSTQVTVCYI